MKSYEIYKSYKSYEIRTPVVQFLSNDKEIIFTDGIHYMQVFLYMSLHVHLCEKQVSCLVLISDVNVYYPDLI